MKQETLTKINHAINNLAPGTLVAFNTEKTKGDEAYYIDHDDKVVTVINRNGYLAYKPWSSFTEMVIAGFKIDLKEEGLKR